MYSVDHLAWIQYCTVINSSYNKHNSQIYTLHCLRAAILFWLSVLCESSIALVYGSAWQANQQWLASNRQTNHGLVMYEQGLIFLKLLLKFILFILQLCRLCKSFKRNGLEYVEVHNKAPSFKSLKLHYFPGSHSCYISSFQMRMHA